MNQVKCECGHVNPHGTVLCEACGKALGELENDKTIVDMRYEEAQGAHKRIIKRSLIKYGIFLVRKGRSYADCYYIDCFRNRNDFASGNVHSTGYAGLRIL